jgi:hypothetical protein
MQVEEETGMNIERLINAEHVIQVRDAELCLQRKLVSSFEPQATLHECCSRPL